MKTEVLTLFALLFAFAESANAVIVIDTESSTGTPLSSTPWFGNLSSVDLINAGQPTLASVTRTGVFFGANGTNDGQSTQSGAGSDTTTNTYIPSEASGALASKFTEPGGEWWATFNLNLTTNTDGYDITSIESFTGFNANSELHANQIYSVEFSEVGSSLYVPLTSVSYAPFSSVDGSHHFSHVSITDDESGVLARNVDSIRFRLSDPGNGGGTADGTVINELDVYGIASIPVVTGDVNGDGFTNSADLEIIRTNYNRNGELESIILGIDDGDLLNDNVIDYKDYAVWKRLPKDPDPLSSITGAQAPEPASFLLLGPLALWCIRRRTH